MFRFIKTPYGLHGRNNIDWLSQCGLTDDDYQQLSLESLVAIEDFSGMVHYGMVFSGIRAV